MTASYFRAAAVAPLFLAAAAAAQPPQPAKEQPVVLLLDDFTVVKGTFALDADGNYARVGGKQVVAAKRVRFVGTSDPEVRAYIAHLAKAEPAPKPPGGLNAVAANAFPTRIQPLLTNLCAGCHAKPDHAGGFRLKPVPAGYADGDAARANLAAAAAFIDRGDPSASGLLTKMLAAHGGQKAPALPRRDHPAARTLELWAHGLAAADGSPLPAALPPPRLGPPPAVFVSKPPPAPPKPAAAKPADPFDPAEFNRAK